MKSKILILITALLFLAILAPFAIGAPSLTNFVDHVHINTLSGTATPALMVNQNGPGKLFEVKDGGTPVFSINNGGGIVASQLLTQGVTIENIVISQPTAAATATPALLVNSLAAGSNLLEVRDSATPVFVVENGGQVTGFVVGSATSGQQENCGSQSITAAATVVHGLATPVVALCSLAADPTGNQYCTYTNAAGVVTVKVWQDVGDATPVANNDAVSVSWCVRGTP